MSSIKISIYDVEDLVKETKSYILALRQIENDGNRLSAGKKIERSKSFWNKITLGLIKYTEPSTEEIDDQLSSHHYMFIYPSTTMYESMEVCTRLEKLCDQARKSSISTLNIDSKDLEYLKLKEEK